MKIVLNRAYGGFCLSDELMAKMNKPKYSDVSRINPTFIEAVENAEDKGDLRVMEIPDGSHYVIINYDGNESLFYSSSPITEV